MECESGDKGGEVKRGDRERIKGRKDETVLKANMGSADT